MDLASAIIRLGSLGALAFIVAVAWEPLLSRWLYRFRFWKQQARAFGPDGRPTPIFQSLHREREVAAPRAGGLLIWLTVIGLAMLTQLLSWLWRGIDPSAWLAHLEFLDRGQTWLPLFTLFSAGIIGFADDYMVVRGLGGYAGGGIRFRYRLLLVLALGLIGAWWFTAKLGYDTLHIPLAGDLYLGPWLYGLFFILVLLGTFSSSVVDGLDGLSAGVFGTVFLAYAGLAFARGQYDLATLIVVMIGAMLAYLWFNIPPARFYMGETGILALTTTLTVVAFLTNQPLLLPIIGLVLVAESLSVAIQLLSKKFRNGKKVFLVAPLHHHLEAIGWPAYKVVMRFWVISLVAAAIGLVIGLVDQAAG